MNHQLCARVFLVFGSAALLLSTQSHAQNQMRPEATVLAVPIKDAAQVAYEQACAAQAAGDNDRAFELYQRVLQIPPPPGAHPPSMLPGPVDMRGEARWMMAQIRRSQGRWKEALVLYQLNRETYPRDDGCVQSGGAFQEMAMTEGECLEHLGRFDEAVALYFPAALNLSAGVTPEAMRRLVELYSRTGQLDALKSNVTRERAAFELQTKGWMENMGGNEEQQAAMVERQLLWSGTGSFDRVFPARLLVQEQKWNELAAQLREFEERDDNAKWNRREALAALLDLPASQRSQVLPALQRAQTLDKDNDYLSATVLYLQNTSVAEALAQLTDEGEKYRLQMVLAEATGGNLAPFARQYAPIPPGLKLPALLPVVFKASANN